MTENSAIPETEPPALPEVKGDEFIRIVIADDHPIFRDGLRKLLTLEEDFKVVAVLTRFRGGGRDRTRVRLRPPATGRRFRLE